MLTQKQKLNLANLYLDPTLLSEHEAKKILLEYGYNIEELEDKRKKALEKSEINRIHILAEKNKKKLDKAMAGSLPLSDNKTSGSYNLAARDGSTNHEIEEDKKLIEILKKKKSEE